MSYVVMARKRRPKVFENVVGQDHITTTLQNAIRQDRVAQAYLFSGPRGTGKTTSARLLATALNCENGPTPEPCGECAACTAIQQGRSMDVLEIDGASNRGIDEIRQLREEVGYAASKGKRKVYIIDEVHMLTTEAFNALLKTLEEPPPHVVFVFATTEVHKVPETILSRCQRYSFRRIPAETIVEELKRAVAEEGVEAEEAALYQIGRKADGGMRDALSLLDQVVAFSDSGVTVEAVQDLLGIIPRDLYFELTKGIQNKASAEVLGVVERLVQEGGDIGEFVEGLMEHFRHLLVACAVGELTDDDLPASDRQRYTEAAAHFDETDLVRMLNTVSELEARIGRVSEPRFWVELTVMKLVKMTASVDLAVLLAKLDKLGQGGGSVEGAPWAIPRRPQSAPEPPAQKPAAPQIQTPPPGLARARVSQAPPIMEEPPRIEESPRIQEPPRIEEMPQQAPATQAPEPEVVALGLNTDPPTFEVVKSRWEDFVKEVKGRKISVGTFLSEGYPKSMVDEQLMVAFKKNKDFHANQVRRNRPLVEEVAAVVFGGVVRIECKVDYDMPSNEDGSEADPRAEDDERVQMVLQVFGGEVVR
jgi:DNA polymerase-3 subunit gamma/tau